MQSIVIVGVGLSGLSVLSRCRDVLTQADQIILYDQDRLTSNNLARYPRLPHMRPGKLKAAYGRQYLINVGYSGSAIRALPCRYNSAMADDMTDDTTIVDCSDSPAMKADHLSAGHTTRIVTGLDRSQYWAAYLPPGSALSLPLQDRVATRPSCGDQAANGRHLQAALRLGAIVRSLLLRPPFGSTAIIAGGGNNDD